MDGDKSFYDESDLRGQEAIILANALPFLQRWASSIDGQFPPGSVDVLELGAGSCTSSLYLSNLKSVRSITASDISGQKMATMSSAMQKHMGGVLEKLKFVESNFNDPLPFADNTFDIVVMDAALHHSRNIWVTLSEIRRVLKNGGTFVAQREAYVSPLTHWHTFQVLLASPEIAAGVSENAFTTSQYDYYLRVHNFTPSFQPVLAKWWQKAFFFLNGIIFSKYNIISKLNKDGG